MNTSNLFPLWQNLLLNYNKLQLLNLHTDFWKSEIQNKVKKEKNPHREPFYHFKIKFKKLRNPCRKPSLCVGDEYDPFLDFGKTLLVIFYLIQGQVQKCLRNKHLKEY